MKEYKNMQWFPNRPPDQKYMNMDIGIKLEPPIVDKYLRQLAAGHTIDAMKVFLAQSLMLCMNDLNRIVEKISTATGDRIYSESIHEIHRMAKEVDLDFVDIKLEADTTDAECESGRHTGVSK